MLERFYPKIWLASPYDIPWEDWHRLGVNGAVFDIDNTLVEHNAPASDEACALFLRLRDAGIRACLLSNNKEPRVASFAAAVGGCPYLYKAGKPGRKGYEKAMELMKTDRKSTVCVGDQLFTDIWGANRAGLYTVLVNPISPREEIQIVLKRCPEKFILHFYKRNHEYPG